MANWYVADFETTGKKFYKINGYTKVWLWSISDSDANIVEWGETIEGFMEALEKLGRADVYFHNLKFDGSFILNHLLKNNWTIRDKIKVHENAKGFSTLITDDGLFYQIKMNFGSRKVITLLDSSKLIPLKVEQMAKIFELPIRKLKIDYEDYTITPEVLEYVFNDVKIVAKSLKFFKDMEFNKMTIGSNAYNQFFKENPQYEQLFPKLSREWNEKWRKAYRGGRTQVNPIYANKKLSNVKRYDINSMYPYVMSRMEMPYGRPIKIDKRGEFKFELYEINVMFKLKKGHLPTLLKSGSRFTVASDTYYTETEGIEKIHISNIDLDLLYKHYDIKFIQFVEMWGFKTHTRIFRKFIDKYYHLKNISTGGMKLLYKLIINNLYGKFGSRPYGAKKLVKLEDNTLTFETQEKEEMKEYYLPVAIAITSWAHKLIDDAIEMTGIKNFVYCDTDSVHTLGVLPKEFVDNKEIGKFKLEGVETLSKYVRQKCYIYKDDEGYTITCAGMTQSLKEYLIREYNDDVFDVFKTGLKIDETSPNITDEDFKLRPKQVNGGVILMPVPFSLN